MGKVITIIFAAVSLILLPVSLYYIGTPNVEPPAYTIDIQGNLYDAKIGDYLPISGFFFFKFSSTGNNIFVPESWNQAFTGELVFGLPTGTFLYILWLVGMGLALIGIIVAIFATKISGIFFLLTALIYGFQAIIWHLGMNIEYSASPEVLHFPLPVGSLFFLVVAIIAFASKKKEAYYYSPGYSYGYGRR
ncbi:MAG: hypothetical protein EAX90_05315 [Candidatus Heimdallarchaeota archaeon]|nr:hypothetical protein [Candidatus Heimdallarchaeota archaeon]